MARTGSESANYPKFLGIGASRSGTTWLFDCLSQHPGVWIPRVKEIHYFTRSTKYLGPSQVQGGSIAQRLFSPERAHRRYRQKLIRAIASNIVHPSINKLRWDTSFFFRKPNDAWYANLFAQGDGKVTGEITPRYSILDLADIEKLKLLMPDVKLIFIMREPVDRTWSTLKYHEKRSSHPLTSLPIAELIDRALHPAILEQSDYESILGRWRSVFPPQQFFTAYFDEIIEDPDALQERICSFLQIPCTATKSKSTGGKTKVNPSFEKSMPAALQTRLIERYAPMIERLSRADGGYFSRWLESYEPYRVTLPDHEIGTARKVHTP